MWTFLDETRDPDRITPGALVVAGDEDAAAVCQVVDLVPVRDGTVVHLRLLPGLVGDYRAPGSGTGPEPPRQTRRAIPRLRTSQP